MRRNITGWMTAAIVALFCALSHAGEGSALFIDEEGKGDSAPDFTLEDYATAGQVSLGSYLGKKVVMLEFWATWCDICKEEIPALVKIQNDWKDKNFQILAITLSPGDPGDRKKIQKQVEKHGINYPLLLDTEYKVAQELYKLKGPIPLKLIIDCAGKLRKEYVGDAMSKDDGFIFMLEALTQEPSCGK
ncbi:TlpA family protein disulfide reductase [bacterium]|nr:MAG: TlpA family protein disulfide reductase [bacterium]